MKNEKILKEQSYLDKIIRIIYDLNNKRFIEIEDARLNYYNTDQDLDEQYRKQYLFDSNINKMESLKSVISKPFFGKIETIQTNGNYVEFYIGHKNLINQNETLVFDWKSPAGKAFRNRLYKLDEANIMANIHFQIEKGKINDIDYKIKRSDSEDETELFDNDDVLLKNNKAIEFYKANKDIIPSISKNQNFILDYDQNRNLIIQGVPGSGKTALGGLRISLITDQLNSVFSENEPYINYGVFITNNEMMKLYSQGFYKFEDIKSIKFLSIFESLKLLSYKITKTVRNTCYISDLGLKGKIKSVDEKNKRVIVELDSGQLHKVELNKIQYIKYDFNSNLITKKIFGPNASLDKILNFQNTILSEEEFNFLNDQKLINYLSHSEFYKYSDFEINKLINMFGIVNSQYLINLLRIVRELLGLKRNNQIYQVYDSKYVSHLFIDEAQGYSIVDLFILRIIYPNANFTLSGDVNQSDGLNYSHKNWDLIKNFLSADVHPINTCFRSSKKIIQIINERMVNKSFGKAMGWTNKNLGIVKKIKSFEDFLSYDYPKLETKDICILYLNDETRDKISLFDTKKQFKIYNAYQVKGMEFHTVVILDTDLVLNNKFKKRFFYMLVSRAIVNLYILDNKS